MAAHSKTEPTRASWYNMHHRCYNSGNPQYKDYGGRGITVCDEWFHYPTFLADMGERPKNKTLDRKDNNQGYSKDNCYWATPVEQNNNRRPRSSHPQNKTGILGVSWHTKKQVWTVYYKDKYVTQTSDFLEACAARKSLEAK